MHRNDYFTMLCVLMRTDKNEGGFLRFCTKMEGIEQTALTTQKRIIAKTD